MLKSVRSLRRLQCSRQFSQSKFDARMATSITERSTFFKQLTKVMAFKSEEELICQKLQRDFLSEIYTGDTPIIDLLNAYFQTRKQIGRNENVIHSTLELLAGYHSLQGDHFFHLRDLFGKDLFSSAKFEELIEDLSVFLRPDMEFDAGVFAKIIDCFKILGYKNRKVLLAILDRALVDLKGKTDLGRASAQFSKVFSEDVKRIMQIDSTYAMTGEQKLKVIEQAAGAGLEGAQLARKSDEIGEFSNEHSLADEEVLEAEKAVEILRGASLASEQLIFEFRAGVTALRDNYFSLKHPQKIQLLRRNPELLLDFLSIEEQMIQIGLLMPVDLLSSDNQADTNEIALNQSALEAGVDSRLSKAVRPLPDTSETHANIFAEKNRQREIRSAVVVAKIVGWMRTPRPSVDPDDDITDTRFGYLFGRDNRAYEKLMDDASPNKLRTLQEQGSIVSKEGAKVPVYIYSYAFKDFADSLRQGLDSLRFDEYTYETNLLLSGALSFAGLAEPKVEAALAAGKPQPLNTSTSSGLSEKKADAFFVEGLGSLLEFVPWKGFVDWLAAIDQSDLFSQVSDSLISTNGYRHFKADLLFLAEAARQSRALSPSAEAAARQVASTGVEVFESLLDTHRKTVLPDDGSLLKAWTYLAAAEMAGPKAPLASSDSAESPSKSQAALSPSVARSLSSIEGLLVQDHSISIQRDRPYFSIYNSVRSQFSGIDSLLRMRVSEFLPPQLAPVVVASTNGGLKSLHLLPFGVTRDSVFFALLARRVAEVGEKLGVGKIEAHGVQIRDFFEDKCFNETFNFTLDSKPETFAANFGPLVGDAYSFREIEPVIEKIMKSAAPEQKKLLIISLRALEAWAARLSAVPPPAAAKEGVRLAVQAVVDAIKGTQGQEENAKAIKEFAEKILKNESTAREEETSNKGHQPLSTIAGSSALPFVGRRYGFEGFDASARQPELIFSEFCNRILLNNPDYLLFDSWSSELTSRFSSLDFGRCGDRLVSENCSIERVLLPNPEGRSQIKVPDFGLFWEHPGSDRSNLTPDQLLRFEKHGHSASKVSPISFNVALLNTLYSFRALPSFGEFFAKFFKLPFWSRLITTVLQGPSSEKTPIKLSSPFDPKDINRVLSTRLDSSPYARGFEKYKALMKEVEYWRNMCEVILPQRFQNSNKEEEKLEISKEHDQAQKNYLESLKHYREVFSDHSTMYNNEDFHDLVTRVEYKDTLLETEDFTDTPHFSTKDDLVRSSVADLLYAYLVSKTISKTPLTSDEQKLFDAFETKNGELRTLPLGIETNISLPIAEIFGEKDFEFFANELVFADFKKFASHDFADLAVTLGLMINKDLLDFHRVSTHLKKLAGEDREGLDEIILDFARYVPNRLFFNFHQLEAVSSHVSKRLNDTDLTYLQKLFGIGKGDLIR